MRQKNSEKIPKKIRKKITHYFLLIFTQKIHLSHLSHFFSQHLYNIKKHIHLKLWTIFILLFIIFYIFLYKV